eukprot:scaffold234439_cov29-Tisochrysis_lutea.AAC.4
MRRVIKASGDKRGRGVQGTREAGNATGGYKAAPAGCAPTSPLMVSIHLASHVTVLSWTTSPHLCFLPSPRSGTGGT